MKITHLIFPEDLSPKRYISLEFFLPANDINIKNLISSMKNMGITTVKSISGRDNVSFKQVKEAFSNLKDSTGDVVKKASSELNKKNESRSSFIQRKIAAIVYLPLPNSLGDSLNNNYEASSGAISNLVSAVNNGKVFSSINEISNSIGARNVLANSDMNLLYKGSNLRNATLTWTFSPRNKTEAKNIVDIIKTIRKYASPDSTISRHFLLSPAFVTLTLSNPELNDIQRYKDMVISSVTVDYGSSGAMEMFYDGIPKEITLSISLSELKMTTMQDWDNDKTYLNEKKTGETYKQRASTIGKTLEEGLNNG